MGMESSAFAFSNLNRGIDAMSEISFVVPETQFLARDEGKKENPEEEITINLSETKTFMVFHKIALCIPRDEEDAFRATEKTNREYDENTKNRHASDICQPRESQTVNVFSKKKKLQTHSVQ